MIDYNDLQVQTEYFKAMKKLKRYKSKTGFNTILIKQLKKI